MKRNTVAGFILREDGQDRGRGEAERKELWKQANRAREILKVMATVVSKLEIHIPARDKM